MSYDDEWETGSGFTLDGATAQITNMEFGFNSGIGQGTFANLTLTIVDGSESGDPGEEIEQSFSVGGKFEASRDGQSLEGHGKINKNSTFGILMDSVVEVLVEDGYNPGDVIGNPKETDGWLGQVFTWGTIEKETMNPSTKEKGMRSKFIVTEYHGSDPESLEADEADADEAPAPAKKAPAKKLPAKKTAAAKKPALPAGLSQEQFDYYVSIAQQYEDHDEFAQAMLDDEDVAADPKLQQAIMSTKPGSIWASK